MSPSTKLFVESSEVFVEAEYKMPFGKYKGSTLAELNPQYINFLLIQEWFNSKDVLEKYIVENNIQLILQFGKYKHLSIKEIDDESYLKFLKEKKIVADVFF